MKHIKFICSLLFFSIILMIGNNTFAAKLPKMKDKYVTDAANILSKSELKQLREDVKSMCDYYSTRIMVGIVSTFDGYDIEEYAEKLGKHWNLDNENTMFIIVKPKSDDERGEAMILTSPDLEDVFSSDVCQEIVNENMIPHFIDGDYFSGLEAALEYLNNMSDEEDADNIVATMTSDLKNSVKSNSKSNFLSDSIEGLGIAMKGLVSVFLWLLCIVMISVLLVYMVIRIKRIIKDDQQEDNNKLSRFNRIRTSNKKNYNSDNISDTISHKKEDIIPGKAEDKDDYMVPDIDEEEEIENWKPESLNREYEQKKRKYERQEFYDDDYEEEEDDDDDDDDDDGIFEKIKDIQDLATNSPKKESSMFGKVVKGTAMVGGALLLGKLIKNASDKHDDDDNDDDNNGQMNKMGSIFGKKNKKTKTSSKLKLGGKNKSSSNSGKPRLGGGSQNSKPKLKGGSGKGSW